MASHEVSHIVPDGDAGTKQESGPVLDTIWKACAYGDFERLREFVTTNPSLVNTPDEQGLRRDGSLHTHHTAPSQATFPCSGPPSTTASQ